MVVEDSVAGQRVATVGPGRPVEGREATAGLFDDHLKWCEVPEGCDRLQGQIGGTLGHQHERPEVADLLRKHGGQIGQALK